MNIDSITVRTLEIRTTYYEDDGETFADDGTVISDDTYTYTADDIWDDDDSLPWTVAKAIHDEGGRLEGGDWFETFPQPWSMADLRDGADRQQMWHIDNPDHFRAVAAEMRRLQSITYGRTVTS